MGGNPRRGKDETKEHTGKQAREGGQIRRGKEEMNKEKERQRTKGGVE